MADVRELAPWLRAGATTYDPERVARVLYEAYCADADWKSVHGEPLPAWDEQRPVVRAHWLAGVVALLG